MVLPWFDFFSLFKPVVPKLVRAVTQIKVSIMSYYPQLKFFTLQVENFFCSDRS